MVEVRWTVQAEEDVATIAEYIAKDSEKYAKIQVDRFLEAAEILETYPKTGRIIPETNLDNLRELIVGNYRIMYALISDTRVDILSVHHSKRLLSNNPAFD